ncbi:DUF2258 domain-containing protein [Hyperthermus butylicus]|uniref:Conserved archaeal protein n=1 Tax=Hyperthermus butylicus (strain DSM 5456 / JCM 9403 / PLM1-5) TaxID=415426 RepID=A2BM40_HYPBU|nr:DUF2258 domain-containing protein [Hyperthermus butylicus]ABM81051.1 conserved archaeal protein [Hyperthermus butylicus DSM 5456]
MPQLSTGLVIAGAYADKLRRVLFAQLRDEIKKGAIEPKQVAYRAGELNRLLFEILVNKLRIDKGDVVRIRIEYELRDGDIVWKLDTLRVEAFRRIPDEDVEKTVREVLQTAKEVLARPVTEEEKAWTEAREVEVEREVQRVREERIASAQVEEVEKVEKKPALPQLKPPVEPAEAIIYGETRRGEKIAMLKDAEGNNIGLAILNSENSKTRATIILIADGDAYKAETTIEKGIDELENAPEALVEAATTASYTKMTRDEAMRIIQQKMEEII